MKKAVTGGRPPGAGTSSEQGGLSDSVGRKLRSAIPFVLDEWGKPDGVLASLAAQLPALRAEARALAEGGTWSDIPPGALLRLVNLYAQLLRDIWLVYGPVVLSSPEAQSLPPQRQGDTARFLFLLSLLYRRAASEDPFGWPFLIYMLAEHSTCAAEELERRIDFLARLGLELGLPDDSRRQDWRRLEWTVPSVDLRRLESQQAAALSSLKSVANEVEAGLDKSVRYFLTQQEGNAPTHGNEAVRLECARATVEALRSLAMDDAELILRHRRASLVKAIVKRIRTEVQTAKRFEHRHRGVDKDWKLDRVVQEAQKAGRLPKEPLEQEITVSIFQEDQAAETPSTDAELHHWVEANFDALIRKFLALRRYRKHRAAMRWLQSDTPPDRHRLARRRGISSAAIRHREKQALTDFGLWLHEATRQERPQQHPSAGQK